MKTRGQNGCVQADLGDTAGVVPDHCKKANIAIRESHEFFGFPVPIKVTLHFTVVC